MDDAPQLSPSEERIIEFLRAGILDAEIAVRLGLSVGETKEKIERLRRRLGLDDRRALAGWQPGESPARPETDWSRHGGARRALDDIEIDAGPLIDFTGRQPKRHSRRAILGMAGAGAAVLAGGGAVAAAVLRSRGSAEAPTASDSAGITPTTTPGPVITLAPSPTATPLPGLGAITQTSDEWQRMDYRPGEALLARSAIYFMDVETGGIEGWWRNDADEISGHRVLRGNRWLVGRSNSRGSTGIFDRESGSQFRFDNHRLRLIAGSANRLLFEETKGHPGGGSGNEALTGRFLIADERMMLVRGFSVDLVAPQSYQTRSAVFSPEGGSLAMHLAEASSGAISVYLISSESGEPQLLHSAKSRPGISVWAEDIEAFGDDGFVIGLRETWAYPPPSDPGAVPGPEGYWFRHRWTGEVLDSFTTQGWMASGYFSPDGTLRAYEQDLRAPESSDWNLAITRWPAVVVADVATGAPRFRVLGAAFNYGDFLSGSRWFADSSAVTAITQGGRFVPIQAAGALAEPLPDPPPTEERRWYAGSYWSGALPNPSRPELIAYGRYAVWNTGTEQWFVANLPPDGPAHHPIWNGVDDEMVITTVHGHHDGAIDPPLLPPKVEFPPFDDRMRFSIATGGDCLNLRVRPSLKADVVACLPLGAVVELDEPEPPAEFDRNTYYEDPSLAPPGHAVHHNWEDALRYVHVRAPSGETGWVAIQYLDWA